MTESKQALAARRRSTALVCSSNGMQTFWRVETAIAFAFLGTSTNSCIKHCTMLSRARAQASGQRASNTPATGHDDKQCGDTCGGLGCGARFYGSKSSCCQGAIKEAAKPCGTAPCVKPTVTPPTTTKTCSAAGGILNSTGDVCCSSKLVRSPVATECAASQAPSASKLVALVAAAALALSFAALAALCDQPFDQQVLLLFAIGSDAQHTHTAACYTTATEHRCKNGGTCVTRGYGYTNTPIFDKCVCTGGHTGTYCEK
eukprot:14047-Heterococcus_DN1.PRE.3